MPTFTSPVALADFQTYLKDSSVDPTVTGFFQTCLDAATEAVYTWLDRDYTASATKTDIFWGDDTQFYAPKHPAGSLLSWTYTDFGNGYHAERERSPHSRQWLPYPNARRDLPMRRGAYPRVQAALDAHMPGDGRAGHHRSRRHAVPAEQSGQREPRALQRLRARWRGLRARPLPRSPRAA